MATTDASSSALPQVHARPVPIALDRWHAAVAALAAVSALSRLPFRSRVPFNWDSVQYLLAMAHFDIASHQPQPPGNPLYVLLGRAAHLIIPDANQALVAVSILATVVVVVLTAVVGRRLAGPSIGLWAAALIAVNPLFWLYGDVALSYVPEAAAGLIVALVVWTAYQSPSARSMVVIGVAIAAAGGLRPTVLVLLTPLWLFGLWHATWRQRALAVGVAALGCLLWFVPLVVVSGGPSAYLTQLRLLSGRVDGESTIGGASLAKWIANVGVTLASFALGVSLTGLAALIALGARRLRDRRLGSPGAREVFLGLWILPPMAVFTLVHLGQVGYVLLILPPAVILCLLAVGRAWPRVLSATSGLALLAVLLATTLALTAATLPLIAQHDEMWHTVQTTLAGLPANDTVLLAATDQQATFRLAGYLLPRTHALGFGIDLGDQMGVVFEALNGRSTFRLDPTLHACQVVRLEGVRNLVVTGDALVKMFVGDGQWSRTTLADGTHMLVRQQATPGMTVIVAGSTVRVEAGLMSGAGLNCTASRTAPLRPVTSARS